MDESLRAGLALHHSGRIAEAAAAYRNVLSREPASVDALHMLGMACHQLGQSAEGLTWLDRALRAAPDSAGVLANRAAIHLALDQPEEAERDALAALVSAPEHFGAWLNLGLARQRIPGRREAAVTALRHASERRPQHPLALLHWFGAAGASRQLAGVAARARDVMPPLGDLRDLALDAARALEEAGSATGALALLARLRMDLPNDPQVAAALGVEAMYRNACELEYRRCSADAITAAGDVLARQPRHRGARLLRAELTREYGEIDAALAEYDELLRLHPLDSVAASSRLITLQHAPRVDADTLDHEHRAWGRTHAPTSVGVPAVSAYDDPERVLRVGWLSPRFSGGVVETFFAAAFEALDRSHFQHVLYDNGSVDDAANARFRAAAAQTVSVDDLDDGQLVERIQQDRIDLLIELSGHGPGNRLRAVAARAAPVQMSWLDYFHSTGVEAIDFMISDERLSPPALAGHYGERLLYLPSGRLCYAPVAARPEKIVARDGGPLRFACFNRMAKMNDRVLTAWARIMDEYPGAVLRLKASGFDDAQMRERFLARCEKAGIAAQRLELEGYGSHAETFAAYADVDIALDTFPFSGCATTCDALAMGVAVVALRGETMAGRQSASLLDALGLEDCVAHDADDYVARASALAADPQRRATLRAELPALMHREIGDIPRHARELAAAIRQAWRLHCAESAVSA